MSPSTEARDHRQFATEIKFLISPVVADQIRQWARARLSADPHAAEAGDDRYRITSLYFDTDASDVFHRRRSFKRSKYRIRRYGQGTTVFLERKLKTRRLLAKRRANVALTELPRLTDAVEPDWVGCWFHRRLQLRRLRPVCQIAYDRTARVAMTARGPIRLTLDDGLRAMPVDRFAFEPGDDSPILEESVVLELKFLVQIPALFKQLVEEFRLAPQRFSKYRHAAATLDLVAPKPSLVVPFASPQLVPAYA